MALILAATALAVSATLATPGTAAADQNADGNAGGNAAAVIAQWQSNGYQVNIDRVGSGPLNDCVVTSVRNPNTSTQLVRINRGGPTLRGNSFLVPVVTSRTVQVSLDCTR